MKQSDTKYRISYFTLIIFAVAMGLLEAIVVVYVRELYYPEGFAFPLQALPARLITIEIIRELCTLLMLGSISWLSGKTLLQRLSVFLFTFGVWDIIYYIGLKLFLGWPESVLTWDILFLIPITWIGPVLAPIICSIVMILMAILFQWFHIKKELTEIKRTELKLMIAGAAIIFFTFTYDFGMLILEGDFISNFFTLPENPNFINAMIEYVPTHFMWEIFASGILLILIGIGMVVKRVFFKNN